MAEPKYETGRYLVLCFNKHGTQVGTHKAETYTQAHAIGKERTSRPPAASYVVTRVMYNSLDAYYPWQVPEDDVDVFDATVRGTE